MERIKLVTERLLVESVHDQADPKEFLPLFNSNPEFIEATELFAGKRSYDASDVEMNLWQAMNRENGVALEIRLLESEELVGVMFVLIPHSDKAQPWIGLLLISRQSQNQGYGAEAILTLEKYLVGKGWHEVYVNLMQAVPKARHFWEQLGYVVLQDSLDSNKRPCWTMRKELS